MLDCEGTCNRCPGLDCRDEEGRLVGFTGMAIVRVMQVTLDAEAMSAEGTVVELDFVGECTGNCPMKRGGTSMENHLSTAQALARWKYFGENPLPQEDEYES